MENFFVIRNFLWFSRSCAGFNGVKRGRREILFLIHRQNEAKLIILWMIKTHFHFKWHRLPHCPIFRFKKLFLSFFSFSFVATQKFARGMKLKRKKNVYRRPCLECFLITTLNYHEKEKRTRDPKKSSSPFSLLLFLCSLLRFKIYFPVRFFPPPYFVFSGLLDLLLRSLRITFLHNKIKEK